MRTSADGFLGDTETREPQTLEMECAKQTRNEKTNTEVITLHLSSAGNTNGKPRAIGPDNHTCAGRRVRVGRTRE